MTVRQLIEEEQKFPFEVDELIEVSDDGTHWYLRHFSRMNKEKYECAEWGKTITETSVTTKWKYGRKH